MPELYVEGTLPDGTPYGPVFVVEITPDGRVSSWVMEMWEQIKQSPSHTAPDAA